MYNIIASGNRNVICKAVRMRDYAFITTSTTINIYMIDMTLSQSTINYFNNNYNNNKL